MNLHQRDEAVNLGFVGNELGEDAAQPDRVLTKRRSDPVLALGRRIALVEDQVDHLEDRSEPRRACWSGRELKPDVRLDEGPLRANDPLGDGRYGDEERACDLLRRQSPEDAERQRDASVRREDGVARHEHEAEEIVPEGVLSRRVRAALISRDAASELLVLAVECRAPSDQIGRSMPRSRHEPGTWFLRYACGGPLFECCDERVLCELLSRADVTDEPSQPGDEPGRLDSPDRFDRAMRFTGRRLAATRVFRLQSRFYGATPFTRPRAWRPRGPRRSRRHTARASATPKPRRASGLPTHSSRPPAPCSPRTGRR